MAIFIRVHTFDDTFYYINVDNIQAFRPIEPKAPWDNERTAIYMNGGPDDVIHAQEDSAEIWGQIKTGGIFGGDKS